MGRQRMSWRLDLPATYRVVERRWWGRRKLSGDRRCTPGTVRLHSLLLLSLLLLLLQYRGGTLRELALWTCELSVNRRHPEEASDPSEWIARTHGTLLPLGSSRGGYGTRARSGGTRLTLAWRLVLSLLRVSFENRTTTMNRDANQ